MKKLMAFLFMSGLIAGLLGCASVNYSQSSPEADDFHPKTIAVLPATVSEYESSRDVIDAVISQRLVKSRWFDNVVDTFSVKTQILNSEELANDMGSYIQKLNTLGVSDPVLAARLGEALQADAILLSYVTSWGYGRLEGNKVARVGLGLKLVEASSGKIMWKANHELVEEYWIIKPELKKLADKLMGLLLKEMPH